MQGGIRYKSISLLNLNFPFCAYFGRCFVGCKESKSKEAQKLGQKPLYFSPGFSPTAIRNSIVPLQQLEQAGNLLKILKVEVYCANEPTSAIFSYCSLSPSHTLNTASGVVYGYLSDITYYTKLLSTYLAFL